jgi:23S rRNA (cytidine2498-2'-O)-methyltransferase
MSSAPLTSPFCFVSCQPGAEAFVKADVAQRHPLLRLAFSRPGFVTFKNPDGVFAEDMPAPTFLARAWGPALGPSLRGRGALREACERLSTRLAEGGAEALPAVLHVFQRDVFPVGEEPLGHDPWAQEAALAARVKDTGACPWPINVPPAAQQRVLNLMEVDPDTVFVGAHRAVPGRRPTAGGRPPRRTPPADVPSRVWFKMEEAIWWTGASPGTADTVLDLGCAPGGGPLALLHRGARVVGVDPGDMHPAVLLHPNFRHVPRTFEQLSPADLPRDVSWLVFDVNLSPTLTLDALRRLCVRLPRLQQAFITLKLNGLDHVDKVDWMLLQLREAGFSRLAPTQLFHNRQELFVHAQR